MLYELIDNRVSDYSESRSHVKFEEYNDTDINMNAAVFTLCMANMPKSIISQLDKNVIGKKFPNIYYSLSSNRFGITQTLHISVNSHDFINKSDNTEEFINTIKYILSTITL